MSPSSSLRVFGGLAILAALSTSCANAQDDAQIKHVFVIALENHNWTQPATVAGSDEPVYQNPNAPFINSLVSGTAQAYINGQVVNISKHVSYATAYHNVLATPSGNNPSIHPSEPNYLWAEAGTNFGILNDDDPFVDNPPNSQTTTQHLSGLLQKAGISWKSYQEDIDLATAPSAPLPTCPCRPANGLPPSPATREPLTPPAISMSTTPRCSTTTPSSTTRRPSSTTPTAATTPPPPTRHAFITRRSSSWLSTWPTTTWPPTTGSRPTSTTTSTAA